MEKKPSTVFRFLAPLFILGVAGAALFGLTGVLRDPAVETATLAEQQKSAQVSPPPVAVAMPADAGTEKPTEVAKVNEEPFPQFDEEEPTGS